MLYVRFTAMNYELSIFFSYVQLRLLLTLLLLTANTYAPYFGVIAHLHDGRSPSSVHLIQPNKHI